MKNYDAAEIKKEIDYYELMIDILKNSASIKKQTENQINAYKRIIKKLI